MPSQAVHGSMARGFCALLATLLRPAPAGLYHRLRDGEGATWILLSKRSMRGTFISPRPRKCRAVLVTNANGTQQMVTVCS